MSLDELYQELLLDHFRKPRCQGCISNPDGESSVLNPLCGDKVNLTVKVGEGKITDIGFVGNGCAISQASTSMMSELCMGRSIIETREIIQDFRGLMKGQEPTYKDRLGDVLALEGVRKFSARIKCALLGWEALEQCIDKATSKII